MEGGRRELVHKPRHPPARRPVLIRRLADEGLSWGKDGSEILNIVAADDEDNGGGGGDGGDGGVLRRKDPTSGLPPFALAASSAMCRRTSAEAARREDDLERGEDDLRDDFEWYDWYYDDHRNDDGDDFLAMERRVAKVREEVDEDLDRLTTVYELLRCDPAALVLE